MKAAITKSPVSNHWIFYVTELDEDPNHWSPWSYEMPSPLSERHKVNEVITKLASNLVLYLTPAMYSQPGTTGFEIWASDESKVIELLEAAQGELQVEVALNPVLAQTLQQSQKKPQKQLSEARKAQSPEPNLKVSLTKPYNKGWMFIVRGFHEDDRWSYPEDFNPNKIYPVRADINWYISQTLAKFGFSAAFNQISGEGITGWEFWSSDQDTILNCSLEMAEGLGAELYTE